MKVTSMANNQYSIEHNGVTYFQSYDVIVAKKSKGKTILDKDYYNYSRTTIKYRNMFLGMLSASVNEAIKESDKVNDDSDKAINENDLFNLIDSMYERKDD